MHGIMDTGAPAIYPTGNKILMMSGGSASFVITGLGSPGEAMKWIAEGAELGASEATLQDSIATAVELFNLSGFEPSPRAAFITRCTALEQLFPPEEVDGKTIGQITKIANALEHEATTSQSAEERELLIRLRDRILKLKRDSIARAVQSGVARTLAPQDAAHASLLNSELRSIYKVRHALAHRGRADLGSLSQRLKDVLRQVLQPAAVGSAPSP